MQKRFLSNKIFAIFPSSSHRLVAIFSSSCSHFRIVLMLNNYPKFSAGKFSAGKFSAEKVSAEKNSAENFWSTTPGLTAEQASTSKTPKLMAEQAYTSKTPQLTMTAKGT